MNIFHAIGYGMLSGGLMVFVLCQTLDKEKDVTDNQAYAISAISLFFGVAIFFLNL